VVNGQYILTTKGRGRYVLSIDFVRQLETKPGLHVLSFKLPAAAITTLELVIPEENMKVDVKPMLAATTAQAEIDGVKSTRLQTFLGSAKDVHLSWKPRTEAAEELDAVLICDQFQHINVGEALVNYEAKLNYSIHRGGADSFSISLPPEFRVTDVVGANISKWDVKIVDAAEGVEASQTLLVKLFSAAKNNYSLTIKMERFLQEEQARIDLSPIVTGEVLRRSGLIGITYSQRRVVHLEDIANLARVDTGRLPNNLASRQGVTAYRFITSDYGGTIAIETAKPRIAINQRWMLGVDTDRLHLRAKINYRIERTGIFRLEMNFPEPWKLSNVLPNNIVDDYELKGEGDDRKLHILLKREQTGSFDIELTGSAPRADVEADVDFTLPLADMADVRLYRGQLILQMPEQLRAEIDQLGQLQAISLAQADKWTKIGRMNPAMAFEFKGVDSAKWAGGKFKIAVKPAQVSAVVDRLVNIQAGSIEQEAIINYRIRYAPVDTFYIKMPTKLADAGVEIFGSNIKEKPQIKELPADQVDDSDAAEADNIEWAYFKVVLHSKVSGSYRLVVRSRSAFAVVKEGQKDNVEVAPILAAGKLSDQNGRIAVAKGDTLAIGEPTTKNLIPADPGSAVDLPYEPHRRLATLAFKYNAPPFTLTLPVVVQKEATVFTTIVTGAIIEQVLARDGMCNMHATYVLATSQGDRLTVTLPEGAQLTAVLLNGNEAPVEMGMKPNERIVRLPPSAGQVARFVLEIACGLKDVSASSLTAPSLSQDIPTQQTIWRLWLPADYVVLAHDRVFAQVTARRAGNMIGMIGQNQPVPVHLKLSGQGQTIDFVRQGAPGELSVTAMKKEIFNTIIWATIIVAGVVMLKLSGFKRLLIVLGAALAGGVVNLFQPMLVGAVASVGVFAAMLIVLLWIGHWGFVKIPKLRWKLAAQRAAKRAADDEGESPPDEDEASESENEEEQPSEDSKE
jgi:hypothetical protein